MGGVKVGRSRASLPLRVEVERLRLPEDFLASLEQHLLLVYTGKTRLARNLLQVRPRRRLRPPGCPRFQADTDAFCGQDVVRSWYSRLPAIVQNAYDLVANSEECAKACVEGETGGTPPCQTRVGPGGSFTLTRSSRLPQVLFPGWGRVWTVPGGRRR